jgi:DHA2 family multidrug resistance protein
MASVTTPATSEVPAHPMLVAMVVSIAAFMEVLDTTITNVSLSHIAGSLAASQDESTWVLTSYLVANGIILPLSGWLANVLGRKNFFMMCIGGFTIASFACGVATSLPMLIVFRLLQGLAGGGLQPMQQAITMDSFPAEKRGTAFAITGITMIVAPILGPTLGGFITDNYSWRWIFFMNVPVGIMAVLLVRALVIDPPHAKAKGFQSIDYIGLSLLAIGLGCLQIVLDKGQEDDWFDSNFIITFASISGICLVSAIVWLLKQKDPVVDLRLLGDKYFGRACIMIFFVGFTLYGASTLLPLLVQSAFGYDATLAGLVLSPGGIVIIIFMPIVGKLVNKVQARYLIAFGMALTGFGMTMTSFFTPATDYHTFVIMRILQVAGLPFLFVPTSTMAFSSISKEKSGKASALYSLMRNLGGSAGISIVLSYIARHEQIHQNYLAQNLDKTSTTYQTALAQMTQTIMATGQSHASAMVMATGRLYRQLLNQASILSYGDAFHLFAIITFSLALFALFLPRNKVHSKATDEPVVSH